MQKDFNSYYLSWYICCWLRESCWCNNILRETERIHDFTHHCRHRCAVLPLYSQNNLRPHDLKEPSIIQYTACDNKVYATFLTQYPQLQSIFSPSNENSSKHNKRCRITIVLLHTWETQVFIFWDSWIWWLMNDGKYLASNSQTTLKCY